MLKIPFIGLEMLNVIEIAFNCRPLFTLLNNDNHFETFNGLIDWALPLKGIN